MFCVIELWNPVYSLLYPDEPQTSNSVEVFVRSELHIGAT